MKKPLGKGFVVFFIATIMLITFMLNVTRAAPGLELEKSHEWVNPPGNACAANAVAIGDIDADDATEIVTVGHFNHSAKAIYGAEIDIWHWNGSTLNLEHTELVDASGFPFGSDDTRFVSVAIGDVDHDNDTEIAAAGYIRLGGKVDQGIVSISNWNGTHFTFEALAIWPGLLGNNNTKFCGVALGDVDQDGTTEIVAVGYRNTTSIESWPYYVFHGVITIWNVTDTTMLLEKSRELIVGYMAPNPTYFNAVTVNDVDEDGEAEIIIGGNFWYYDLNEDWALLRIYHCNATDLYFEKNYQWSGSGSAYVHAVATSDVDLDGVIEIITVGDSWDGDNQDGQLRVWSWDGDNLVLETSREWDTGYIWNRIYSIGIGDLDRDSVPEIVTSGLTSGIASELRVWSWYRNVLNLERTALWNATAVLGITADDVDDDTVKELITVGYRVVGSTYNAMLGIWSVSKVGSLITLSLSLSNIVIGNQVVITGTVTNESNEKPIANVEVIIQCTLGPIPVAPLTKVMTDENGNYDFTWTPPEAGTYIISASWNGDFDHEGARATRTLTVNKASSLIALALSRYSAIKGDTVSVNGTLYPAKATPISIEYTTPNGTITTKTVNSNTVGTFNDAFTADQVGEWTVKVSWTGDDLYEGTESSPATLIVTKVQSALSLTASPLTVSVGEDVTLEGTLTPIQIATITLTYTKPDGTTTTKTIASDGAGAFTDISKLDQAGIWKVQASWEGNAQYEAAVSVPVSVTAQLVDLITSTFLAMAGLGLGLIALLLAVLAIYMGFKKKAVAPPPPSTPTQAPPTP